MFSSSRCVYWTQVGDPLLKSTGHVFKADLATSIVEVLNETRLLSPNALVIGNGHLYVGDGHYDKIDIYPFDGELWKANGVAVCFHFLLQSQ